MQQGLRRLAVVGAATLSTVVGTAAFAGAAQAATFNVACGDVAGLRAAVVSANTTAAADVIEIANVDPCVFTFTNSVSGVSPDQSAIAPVTQPLTINGNGARFVRSGANNFRFLRIVGTTVTVNELELANGRLVGTGSQGVFGGAIYSIDGTLTVSRVFFEGNAVSGSSNSRGGAIFNFGGRLTVGNSSFTANTAGTHGGAIASFLNIFVSPPKRAVVTVADSDFTSNTAGAGGAIALDGDTFTMTASSLATNTATGAGGGAIYQTTSDSGLPPSSTISGTTIDANKATGASGLGGGMYAAAGSISLTAGSLSSNTAPNAGALYQSSGSFTTSGTIIYANQTTAAGGIGGGLYTVNTAVSLKKGELGANTANAAAGAFVQGGSLTVTETSVAENTAPGAAGGIYLFASTGTFTDATLSANKSTGTATNQGVGGAVYVFGGTLSMTGGLVDGNTAAVNGGGIYLNTATSTISGTTQSTNKALGTAANQGQGGAVYALNGTLTLTNGSLGANEAGVVGGALYSSGTPVIATGTEILANKAQAGAGLYALGGGLALHGVLAQGNTTTATTASNVGGALVAGNATVLIDQDSSISGNASGFGGAAYVLGGSLTIEDSTIGQNTGAQSGGGIVTAAPVVIRRSTFEDNSTPVSAGAIYANTKTLLIEDSTLRGNSAGFQGGGLVTRNVTGTVRRSTVNGNIGTFSQGAALVTGGAVTFENSTVSQNTSTRIPNTTLASGGIGVAASGAQGSDPAQAGRVDLVSTTLADNGETGNPSPNNQILVNGAAPGAELHATDTIVSDDDGAAVQPACIATAGGTIADDGGNLEFPGTSCGFDTVADPKLEALADNGGETLTHRLLPGSAAIDIGGNDCPATDQRGVTRPGGDACDAGAYETDAPETEAVGPASPTNDPEVTFTSDEETATFECQVDDGPWEACTSPYSPELADGEHTVRVRAVNADGYPDRTPASVTFTVDATGPVVDITSVQQQPGIPATAKGEFTVDGTAEDVECKIDDGAFADCSSPFITGPLTDGEHTLTVRAFDALGNQGSDSQAFTIDTAPPETTITGGPSGTIYTPPATFSFTSSKPNSTFECRLDAGAWAPCTSPKSYTSFSAGTHTFAVRAIDINGIVDPTPATRTFTYKTCLVRITLNGQTVCI